MITGEGTLITKTPGTTVAAGTINHSGILIVKLTRLPCENTIKKIGDMVDRAKASKPRVQDLADRLASYFVPVILTITVLVFTIWIGVGMTIRRQNASVACINAMTYAISVLIVSCPCAIGLAVPMVLIIAGGVAAKHGLIFKDAEAIDTGRKIAHVIFDKTGTLTRGKLSVTSEDYLANDAASLKPVILGLTSNSTHPVSKAIAIHLTLQQHKAFIVQDMVSVAGKGIEANWNRSKVRVGNPFWLGVQDTAPVQKVLALGLTTFCITLDKELVAVYGLEDSLRPDALATVMELKRRSIAISIVSGDNHAAVQSVATQLAIPSTHIRSCFLPEQKQRYVTSLIDSASHQGLDQSCTSKNIVLFVGDGTNDAPPLAAASIGLHMSEGTEVASSAADAVLMRPSLYGVITLIDLSKAFHRRVVFNFAWSFAYNFFAVLLAAGVFSAKKNVRIPPQYAGLGEMVSVVPVVIAAMGLQYRQRQV
ncbi:hypothetical protein B0O99DRAFT_631640 [Bisporella sp. PMI_857]|nr:hypothetical protein B0O99DRAFT_631640 [Bisporella sp. PMI_857]